MNLKKIIALVLCVCMVLSFFPVSVFAEEGDEEIVLTDEEYYEEPQEEYVEEIIEEEPADYVEYVEPVEEIVVEEPAEEPVVEEPAEEPAAPAEEPAAPAEEPAAPVEEPATLETAETFDAHTNGIKDVDVEDEMPNAVAFIYYADSNIYGVAFDNLAEAVAAAGTGEGRDILAKTVYVIDDVADPSISNTRNVEITLMSGKDPLDGGKLTGAVSIGGEVILDSIDVEGNITVLADATATLKEVGVSKFTGNGLTVAGEVYAFDLTMTGTGSTSVDVYLNGENAVFSALSATLNDIMSIVVNAGKLSIAGGNYKNAVIADTATGPIVGDVSGGFFQSIADQLCTDDRYLSDGVIKDAPYVAKIGAGKDRQRFDSLDGPEGAVAAGGSGAKTIVLLKNVDDYELPVGKVMKLDETNFTWTQKAAGTLITEHDPVYAKVTTYSCANDVATVTKVGAEPKYFTTVADAFDYIADDTTAGSEYTLTLNSDAAIESGDEIEIPVGKTVTLDLNGRKAEVETGITVRGTMNIKGRGTLTGRETTVAFRDNCMFYVPGELNVYGNGVTIEVVPYDAAETVAIIGEAGSTITLGKVEGNGRVNSVIYAGTAVKSAGAVEAILCDIDGAVIMDGAALTVRSRYPVFYDDVVINNGASLKIYDVAPTFKGEVQIGTDAEFSVSGDAKFNDEVTVADAKSVDIKKGLFAEAVEISDVETMSISGGTFEKDFTLTTGDVVYDEENGVVRVNNNITGGIFAGAVTIDGVGTAAVNQAEFKATFATAGSVTLGLNGAQFADAATLASTGVIEINNCTFAKTVDISNSSCAEIVSGTFAGAVTVNAEEVAIKGGTFQNTVGFTGEGTVEISQTADANPEFKGMVSAGDDVVMQVKGGKYYGQGRYVKALPEGWLYDDSYKCAYNDQDQDKFIYITRTKELATIEIAGTGTIPCYSVEEMEEAAYTTGETSNLLTIKAMPEGVEQIWLELEAGESFKIQIAENTTVKYSVKAADNRTKLTNNGGIEIKTEDATQIQYGTYNGQDTVIWTASPYVAIVDAERYEDIKEAIDAANASDSKTIVLINDASTEEDINLSGLTVEGANGEDEHYTLSSGHAIAVGDGTVLRNVDINKGIVCTSGAFTLQNVNVISAGDQVIELDEDSAKLVVIGELGVTSTSQADNSVGILIERGSADFTLCTGVNVVSSKEIALVKFVKDDEPTITGDIPALIYNGETSEIVYGFQSNTAGVETNTDSYLEAAISTRITGTGIYKFILSDELGDAYYDTFSLPAEIAENVAAFVVKLRAGLPDEDEYVKLGYDVRHKQYEFITIGNLDDPTNAPVKAKDGFALAEPELVGEKTYKFTAQDNVATVHWTEDVPTGKRIVSEVCDTFAHATALALQHQDEFAYIELNRDLRPEEIVTISGTQTLAFFDDSRIDGRVHPYIDSVIANVNIVSDDGLVVKSNETALWSGAACFLFTAGSSDDATFEVDGHYYDKDQRNAAFDYALENSKTVYVIQDPQPSGAPVDYVISNDYAAKDATLTVSAEKLKVEGVMSESSYKLKQREALEKLRVIAKGDDDGSSKFFIVAPQDPTQPAWTYGVTTALAHGSDGKFYKNESAVLEAAATDPTTVFAILSEHSAAFVLPAAGATLVLSNDYDGTQTAINPETVTVNVADTTKLYLDIVPNAQNTTYKARDLKATVSVDGGTAVSLDSIFNAFDRANNATTNATITINGDQACAAAMNVTKAVTLDLGGGTFTAKVDINVANGAVLTVKNGTLAFDGDCGFKVAEGGKLVLGDDATVAAPTGLTVNGGDAAVITSSGTVEINKAEVNGTADTNMIAANKGTVTVNADAALDCSAAKALFSIADGASAVINGGTIDAEHVYVAKLEGAASLLVNDGSFNKDEVYVSGTQPLGAYVAYGKELKEQEGRFVVVAATAPTEAAIRNTTEGAAATVDEGVLTYVDGKTYTVNGQYNVELTFAIDLPSQVNQSNLVNAVIPAANAGTDNLTFTKVNVVSDQEDGHLVANFMATITQNDLVGALEKDKKDDVLKATLVCKWDGTDATKQEFTVKVPTENFTAQQVVTVDPPAATTVFASEDSYISYKDSTAIVARINNTGYTTLNDAYVDARDKDTIVIVNSFTLNESIDWEKRGSYTIDLNGKTITVSDAHNIVFDGYDGEVATTVINGTIRFDDKDGAAILASAFITVSNNATVTLGDGTAAHAVVFNDSNIHEGVSVSSVALSENTAVLNINNSTVGVVVNIAGTVNVKAGTVKKILSNENAKIQINGGDIEEIKNGGEIVVWGGEIKTLNSGDNSTTNFRGGHAETVTVTDARDTFAVVYMHDGASIDTLNLDGARTNLRWMDGGVVGTLNIKNSARATLKGGQVSVINQTGTLNLGEDIAADTTAVTVGTINSNVGTLTIKLGTVEGNITVDRGTVVICPDGNVFNNGIYDPAKAPVIEGKIIKGTRGSVTIKGGRFANPVDPAFCPADPADLYPATKDNTKFVVDAAGALDSGYYHVYELAKVTLNPNDTESARAEIKVDDEIKYPQEDPQGEQYAHPVLDVAKGDKITSTITATRTGFGFNEWKKGEDAFDFSNEVITEDTEVKADWTATEITVTFTAGPNATFYGTGTTSYTLPVGTDLNNATIGEETIPILQKAITDLKPRERGGSVPPTGWVDQDSGRYFVAGDEPEPLTGDKNITLIPRFAGWYKIEFRNANLDFIQNALIEGSASSVIPASYGSWVENATNDPNYYQILGITETLEGAARSLETATTMYALDDLYDGGEDSFIVGNDEKTLTAFDKVTLKFVVNDNAKERYVATGHTLQGSLDQIRNLADDERVRYAYISNYTLLDPVDPVDPEKYFAGWQVRGGSADLLTSEQVSETEYTANTTFDAVFTDTKTYSITFKTTNAQGEASVTVPVPVNTTAEELAALARTEGYQSDYATDSANFKFQSWDPALEAVTADKEYTAQYKESVRSYVIKFVDEDGETVLQKSNVLYGTTPVYSGKTPTKAATAQYSYKFDGWTPEIAKVTGNATYMATYASTVNKYSVTFVDENGTTVLKPAKEYDYGTTAADIVKPDTPTKAATEQYTYTFKGWSPEITDVTADVTYKATYTSTVNEYDIRFLNGEEVLQTGKVAYGETPAYTGDTPTKAATAQYSYTFSGWDPEIDAVKGAKDYTATFEETVRTYTITYKVDGETVQTQTVAYGGTPTPNMPTKAATAEYTYTFKEWNPALEEVTGEATYNAVFTPAKRSYTVKFLNGNGDPLATGSVEYGETPVYKGTTNPIKAETAQYTYVWDGTWTPEIATVTEDVTYTPNFTQSVRTYIVTWSIGNTSETEEYEYGATPSYKGELPAGYKGWLPVITPVTGDITYTAQSDGQKVAVHFDSNGGSAVADVEAIVGMKLTKPEDPTREGYKFDGWWVLNEIEDPPELGAQWDFDKDTVRGEMTLVAQWSWNDTLKVSKNLELKEKIGINLKVKSWSDDLSNYAFSAEYKNATVLEGTLQELIDTGFATVYEDYVFIPVVDVPSTEMIEKISYVINHVPSDTQVARGDYSVQKYCVNQIDKASSPQLVALCYSMLNYGGRAQLFFPYKANDPAYIYDGTNYDESPYPAIPESYNVSSDTGDCTGIQKASKSLDLGSVISLRFNFKPVDNSVNIADYTFTVNGSPVDAVVGSDGRFLVVVEGIIASELDKTFEVTIEHKDGTSKTVTYSVLSYAYNKQNSSETLADLCKAMYQYHLDAKAIFG